MYSSCETFTNISNNISIDKNMLWNNTGGKCMVPQKLSVYLMKSGTFLHYLKVNIVIVTVIIYVP